MSIEFPKRGLHLDLRIQAMSMPALHALADDVHSLGLNTLLIEWEGTFPFRRHPLIPNTFAYTSAEITEFIGHCTRLGLEVIPLQQCFGHIEYILQHDRYAHLRESRSDLCQLCPCKADDALEIFTGIFQEIAADHPSPYIHIGGDETYLLGHCPACRAKAEKHGKSKLYVDYFKRVARAVTSLGKRPILWADMLLKNPEAAAAMPRECVFMDWNYGWQPNHFGNLDALRKTKLEFWGAPALRSHPDNHALTGWMNHFENLRDFVPFSRSQGYRGQILTSWSTSGVYGYEWDKPGEPTRILPMRRVYPLSGFRILLDTFARACQSADPIQPEDAVVTYARERFGLTTAQGRSLWHALSADATLIERDTDLRPVLRSARLAQRLLRKLRPAKNSAEFAHYLLMADLREFHLRFKQIEARLNAPRTTSATTGRALAALKIMLRESAALSHRFVRLNAGFLQPGELSAEAAYRTRKLRALHDRLARAGRRATQGT